MGTMFSWIINQTYLFFPSEVSAGETLSAIVRGMAVDAARIPGSADMIPHPEHKRTAARGTRIGFGSGH